MKEDNDTKQGYLYSIYILQKVDLSIAIIIVFLVTEYISLVETISSV